MASAAYYFKSGNIWQFCDKGVDVATITIVTKKVNGGNINLATRIDYTQRTYQLLTS